MSEEDLDGARESLAQPDAAPAAQPAAAAATVPEFQIPEAYKEKGWAAKIKSQEDVWKALDNAQSLIGKKTVVPDFDTATPEEVETYLTALRPKDVNAYALPDVPDELAAEYKKLFYDSGLSKPQAQKLFEGYKAFENKMIEKAMSAEGFTAEMQKSFGDKADVNVARVRNEIKRTLSEDDIKVLDALPNAQLGAVYRLVAKQLDAYGVKEGGFGAAPSSQTLRSVDDIKREAADLRNQLFALQNRPHTVEQKNELLQKYTKINQELNKRK